MVSISAKEFKSKDLKQVFFAVQFRVASYNHLQNI